MKKIAILSFILVGCTTEKKTAPDILRTGTVRFVALGDAGEGNQAQYDVANAMKAVCDERGCDFALYLGDNFYDVGVSSIDDEQFFLKFEEPYAGLDFPFYVVLGNHDYGLGHVWEKPDPQVAYSDVSEKWVMPERYHSHVSQHALFIGLDTNAIMWNNEWGGLEDQAVWFQQTYDEANVLWKFAYGHHEYISNGQHGNAGLYDGLENVPIASGADIKNFVEDNLCGKVDIYFSGHDHDMQWLEPKCGTEFIISGAGAKQREYYGWDVPTKFERYNENGFLWVEIVDSTLTAIFFDIHGEILYQETLHKD